jgi:hypothetical protein
MKAPAPRLSALILGLVVAFAGGGSGCGGDSERPLSQANEITAFSFATANNPALAVDAEAIINGTAIAVTLPAGTDRTALIATFTSTGETTVVGGKGQVSGMTANDFTQSVPYRVFAEDGVVRTYLATVTLTPSTAREITAFSFPAAKNPGLSSDVAATIEGDKITVTVPFGTDVKALVAAFTTTGDRVNVGTTRQTSETTANDFTKETKYTVVAQDRSERTYTVTVTVAANSAKAITAYSFRSVNNAVLAADVTATITGTSIAVTVPFDTDVTGLVGTFSTTGASVKVEATAQVSGTTVNDFSQAVQYTVTAADQTTQVFTVTVTVAANSAKSITAYSFLTVNNPGLDTNVTGEISGTTITAEVPFGTSVDALKATFTTTGVGVTVGMTDQVSGITVNDFTNTVEYRVKAADTSIQIFRVRVEKLPPPDPGFGE